MESGLRCKPGPALEKSVHVCRVSHELQFGTPPASDGKILGLIMAEIKRNHPICRNRLCFSRIDTWRYVNTERASTVGNDGVCLVFPMEENLDTRQAAI